MIIYTLWAALYEDGESFWMIAAEDEYSWGGDAERCDKVFAEARARAVKNDWVVREIQITVPDENVARAFLPVELQGRIDGSS